MAFNISLETLNKFNKDLYSKEPKDGARAEFFEAFGGIQGLEDQLKTDLVAGVEESEAKEAEPFQTRRSWFGTNDMPQPKKKWLITMIWEHCQDETIIILSIAAAVSLALGVAFPETFVNPETGMTDTDTTGWVEGVAILVAVIVIVMVGSLQDYDKERKFRALGKEDKRYVDVVRGGSTHNVRTSEVVTGDVVILTYGKFIPADGYVISSDGLKAKRCFVFDFCVFFFLLMDTRSGGRVVSDRRGRARVQRPEGSVGDDQLRGDAGLGPNAGGRGGRAQRVGPHAARPPGGRVRAHAAPERLGRHRRRHFQGTEQQREEACFSFL